jgi:hypothetical protein
LVGALAQDFVINDSEAHTFEKRRTTAAFRARDLAHANASGGVTVSGVDADGLRRTCGANVVLRGGCAPTRGRHRLILHAQNDQILQSSAYR